MSDIGTRRLKITIWFLLTVLVVMLTVPVWADPHPHDDGGGGDTGGAVNVPVDVLVNAGDLALDQNLQFDSKAYALAPPGLGGVAIARCLGSEAWTFLIGGKQVLVLNQVCMAEFYLKVGRYDLAAQALCNQEGIIEEYPSEVACEIDHDFTPAIVEGEDGFDLVDRSAQFEEHYELAQEQEQEFEFMREEQASLVGRLDALTELFEQAPAQAPAPVYIPQEPEPKYTDEDMAYILGLYADGETEDE